MAESKLSTEERFSVLLAELIAMSMEAGMHSSSFIPALKKELDWAKGIERQHREEAKRKAAKR